MKLLRGLLLFGFCSVASVLAADAPPAAPASKPKSPTITPSPLTAEELGTLLGIRSWRIAAPEDVISIKVEYCYQYDGMRADWSGSTIQRFHDGAEDVRFPKAGNEMVIAVLPLESGGYSVSTTQTNGPLDIKGTKFQNPFPGKIAQTASLSLPPALKDSRSRSFRENIVEGDTTTLYRVTFTDDQKKELGRFELRLTFIRK